MKFFKSNKVTRKEFNKLKVRVEEHGQDLNPYGGVLWGNSDSRRSRLDKLSEKVRLLAKQQGLEFDDVVDYYKLVEIKEDKE